MVVWWHYLVGLFAPLFLVNAIPHVVSGLMGRKFPTPFVGGPPNLDTAERNVLWGGINLFIGSALLWLVGESLGNPGILIEMALVGWAGAFLVGRIFARRMPS